MRSSHSLSSDAVAEIPIRSVKHPCPHCGNMYSNLSKHYSNCKYKKSSKWVKLSSSSSQSFSSSSPSPITISYHNSQTNWGSEGGCPVVRCGVGVAHSPSQVCRKSHSNSQLPTPPRSILSTRQCADALLTLNSILNFAGTGSRAADLPPPQRGGTAAFSPRVSYEGEGGRRRAL